MNEATMETLARRLDRVEKENRRCVLVRKGILTNEEVLEEIKAVRREMEAKRGR